MPNTQSLEAPDQIEGGPGDCSVIDVVHPEGGVSFADTDNNTWRGHMMLETSYVVVNGVGGV